MDKGYELKKATYGYLEFFVAGLLSFVFLWLTGIKYRSYVPAIINIVILIIAFFFSRKAYKNSSARIFLQAVVIRGFMIVAIPLLTQWSLPSLHEWTWFILSIVLFVIEMLVFYLIDYNKWSLSEWEITRKVDLEKGYFNILAPNYQPTQTSFSFFAIGVSVIVTSFILSRLLPLLFSDDWLVIRIILLLIVFVFTRIFSRQIIWYVKLTKFEDENDIQFNTEFARLNGVHQEPIRKIRKVRGKRKTK